MQPLICKDPKEICPPHMALICLNKQNLLKLNINHLTLRSYGQIVGLGFNLEKLSCLLLVGWGMMGTTVGEGVFLGGGWGLGFRKL